jgi:hypothetical protein
MDKYTFVTICKCVQGTLLRQKRRPKTNNIVR